MVGIFEDKEAFMSNANDPEQDCRFRRVMEHLESEPRWNDGEVYDSLNLLAGKPAWRDGESNVTAIWRPWV